MSWVVCFWGYRVRAAVAFGSNEINPTILQRQTMFRQFCLYLVSLNVLIVFIFLPLYSVYACILYCISCCFCIVCVYCTVTNLTL